MVNSILGVIKSFFKNKIVRYTFLAVFLGCFIGGSVILVKLYQIAQTLPPVEDILQYRFNEPSMVYDSSGVVIAELGTERRYPISIDSMPQALVDAVVATEDARFYEHGGVDLIGISRAVVRNIRAGRFAEGGSTLTQQLTKNLFFSPEKKLIRKYKEAVLAYRIDKILTKREILEFYLNYVNFGRGGYGVQAAAINYFGKNAGDMTLAECALLAGLPKAPGIYAPHISMERAKQRREHVLFRMYETGYITEAEYLTAKEEPIVITESTPLRLRHAGYFMEYVLTYLSDELGIDSPQNKGLKVYTTLNIDYQEKAELAIRNQLMESTKRIGYFGAVGKFSEHMLDNSATVLEVDDSVVVEQTVQELMAVPGYLSSLGYRKAIVKSMDSQSITIDFATALATGKASSNTEDNATATDSDIGKVLLKDSRWAGVAYSGKQLDNFKTILSINDVIYVTAKPDVPGEYLLEQDPPMEASLMAVEPQSGAILAMVGGFNFEKSMFNRAVQAHRQVGSGFKPIVYSAALEKGLQPMTKILDAPIIAQPNEQGFVWRPKNNVDTYYGETTLKEGLTRSRNIVTIKVAAQIGIGNVIDYARKFGIKSELARDMSISLGSGAVTLEEMVYAFTVFPNLGTRAENPYFVTRVEDADGTVLFDIEAPQHVDVLRPENAQIMTDILINVVEHGTGFRAKAVPRIVGVKTGTSNDSYDAWYLGFTPNLVVGVWSGFDAFGYDVGYGSNAAGPAWVNFVNSIVDTIPPMLFPVADGVVYNKVDTTTWEPTDELSAESVSFEPYGFAVPLTDEQTADLMGQ